MRPMLMLLACFAVLGCEPDVGSPCTADPNAADVQSEPGQVSLRQDRLFDCSKPLCMSSDGSRPYCTRSCVGDLDCPSGFQCDASVRFGALACEDPAARGGCAEAPEDQRIRYCTASSPDVVDDRDKQWLRSSSP